DEQCAGGDEYEPKSALWEGGVLLESHESPFEGVGIEDSDGVQAARGWTCDEHGSEPQKGAPILDGASVFGGELVADHFAGFRNAFAHEAEQRVIRDGQGQQFVREVPCEVLTAD